MAITRRPKPPIFTTDGLLDYIIELIVSEDEASLYKSTRPIFLTYLEPPQAFQLIDKSSFHCLLTYLRPSLEEKDIPHRTKLQAETLSRTKAVEKQIAEVLKVRPFNFFAMSIYILMMMWLSGHTGKSLVYL